MNASEIVKLMRLLSAVIKDLPLTALLTDTARQVGSYLAPGLRTILLDALGENAVFILCPRPLDHLWIKDFLPAMQTLDICSILQLFCYLFPIFGLKQIQRKMVSVSDQSVHDADMDAQRAKTVSLRFYLRPCLSPSLLASCPKIVRKERRVSLKNLRQYLQRPKRQGRLNQFGRRFRDAYYHATRNL